MNSETQISRTARTKYVVFLYLSKQNSLIRSTNFFNPVNKILSSETIAKPWHIRNFSWSAKITSLLPSRNQSKKFFFQASTWDVAIPCYSLLYTVIHCYTLLSAAIQCYGARRCLTLLDIARPCNTPQYGTVRTYTLLDAAIRVVRCYALRHVALCGYTLYTLQYAAIRFPPQTYVAIRFPTQIHAAIRDDTLLYLAIQRTRCYTLLYAARRCCMLIYVDVRCDTLLYAALRLTRCNTLL